jgi:hypothetical protein
MATAAVVAGVAVAPAAALTIVQSAGPEVPMVFGQRRSSGCILYVAESDIGTHRWRSQEVLEVGDVVLMSLCPEPWHAQIVEMTWEGTNDAE